MSKKLSAIAVLAFGMFIAAPLAANAQIPAGVTVHAEDQAPDVTATSDDLQTPEAVAFSSDEDGAADDTAGSTDDVDPQIMQSGVVEDKMLTTAAAPEAEGGLGTGAIVAIAAGAAAVLGAGGFLVVRARKKA